MATQQRLSNRVKRRAMTRPPRGDTVAAAGAQAWLLLTYKVPAEPAKRRIALWRKLKALGAVYLQSGVCVLPHVDSHVRRLKLLQNEITTMDGDAVLLETVGFDRVQEQKVIARFSSERNEACRNSSAGAMTSKQRSGRNAESVSSLMRKSRRTRRT